VLAGHPDPDPAQRFEHLDGDRPDVEAHPVVVQQPGGVQVVLPVPAQHAEVRIDDVQRRVGPECDREVAGQVRLVTAEEVAVVEVAVAAGVGDGLRRLVDRELVGGGEHAADPSALME
jgi:hypothetical protein